MGNEDSISIFLSQKFFFNATINFKSKHVLLEKSQYYEYANCFQWDRI